MLRKRIFLKWLILHYLLLEASLAQAAARKPLNSSNMPLFEGKRVVELQPVDGVDLEMPDQSIHHFGEDFEASMVTRLMNSGRVLITQPQKPVLPKRGFAQAAKTTRGYNWTGSIVPSVRLRIEVEALNFVTGTRGDQNFYGFDERWRNSYNSGHDGIRNEFPLRNWFGQTSWFGNTFNSKGWAPLDSRSGLDLGDGFQINVLFAWLTVKYAQYRAELHLKLHLDLPEVSGSEYTWRESEFRMVQVEGRGFFFDIAGGYQQYSGEIRAARRDAFLQATRKAIHASVSAMDRAIRDQPLMARVDHRLSDGTLLLGTGTQAQVQPGVQYEDLTHPGILIQVLWSEESGAVAQITQGSSAELSVGDILRQTHGGVMSTSSWRSAQLSGQFLQQMAQKAAESESENSRSLAVSEHSSKSALSLEPDANSLLQLPSAFERIQLPEQNFNHNSFQSLGVTEGEAFLKSLLESLFLPYRIARYFLYDQTYHSKADLMMNAIRPKESRWREQVGLRSHLSMRSSPIVAILDSGVDYNHPWIHGSIASGPGQRGWDFISHDTRAYDDHFHGTELASLVLSVAPKAQIMPIKVFSPWGVTSSAALYEGLKYAVEHGAHVILCAWGTLSPSQALREGLELATLNRIPVILAAGDFGSDLNRVQVYPVSLAPESPFLISVAAVDERDRILKIGMQGSDFGAGVVKISAPGKDLLVANPRGEMTLASSSSHAAALVAGALARYQSEEGWDTLLAIQSLLDDADQIPSLTPFVDEGRRLRIRK